MSAHFELSQDPAYRTPTHPAPASANRVRPAATPRVRPQELPQQAPAQPGAAKNSLGCVVAPARDGLEITSVKPYGWCWSCGLEEQDIILTINDRPARSPADLRHAIQDPSKPYVVLMTTTPTGGQFRFCLPLPLGEPELHCMGFLFDQDPKLGFHIVVGLLKNSAAEKGGLVRGCCIRKIDGFPIHGRKEADIRKLIFGGFEDECVLSIQMPGAVDLQDVYIPRIQVRLQGEEGDDAWYCDGWSEKQFDIDQAASKCVHWIGQNPLDCAGNDQGDAITGEFPWAPSPGDYDRVDDVDAAVSKPQLQQPPSSSSGGWELGEEGSRNSRGLSDTDVKTIEHGQALGRATNHGPLRNGPLANADGEVAGGRDARAQDNEESEASLRAMDVFIAETLDNVRAKHEGNLRRLSEKMHGAYDTLSKAQQTLHDYSVQRNALRSTPSSLEAQLRYLETAIAEARGRQEDANIALC